MMSPNAWRLPCSRAMHHSPLPRRPPPSATSAWRHGWRGLVCSAEGHSWRTYTPVAPPSNYVINYLRRTCTQRAEQALVRRDPAGQGPCWPMNRSIFVRRQPLRRASPQMCCKPQGMAVAVAQEGGTQPAGMQVVGLPAAGLRHEAAEQHAPSPQHRV
jgi:hypothetical protein